MKTIIQNIAKSVLLVPAVALALGFAVVPAAQSVSATSPGGITDGATAAKGDDQSSDLFGDTGVFRTITNVLLFIIGAISVIMLIIGGIRYTVSGGDSTAVTAAKNTILYAIIGIIVALLAFAIVNFVLTSFTSS